jgi:putative transposase
MEIISGNRKWGMNVNVVGVDVGVSRSVFAFVGVGAEFMYNLSIVYARQNGVSMLPLGAYDAVTRAFVADITYPSVDKYRGPELANSVSQKALGAVLRAIHTTQRIHGSLVGIALEDLREVSETKRDLIRARRMWEYMINMLGDRTIICPTVRVSWFWLRYSGEVSMLKDGILLILVDPEHTSQFCPKCGRYLGRVRGVVRCDYCGFRADRDVIASINIAWVGFLLLIKCLREGKLNVPKGAWVAVCFMYLCTYCIS